jgi:hypothetical protein
LHFGLSLSESLSLLLTFGFFNSLSFLQLLHFRSLGSSFLKLVKNVLVVKDRVSKLIFESFTAQKLANSALDLGCPQDLMNCGTIGRVFLEHAGKERACSIGKVAG